MSQLLQRRTIKPRHLDQWRQTWPEEVRLRREQNTLQWLLRQQELIRDESQTQTRLREAQQALEQAQPQLAALQQAQPADQLRPLWTRQQEQAEALAQTRQGGGCGAVG